MAEVNPNDRLGFFGSHLEQCRLCPRQCGVNRSRGEKGFCGAAAELRVASYCLHQGEEPPISGSCGSGNIFFSHCNMACVYCQNYPISQLGYGNDIRVADLVAMMLKLETLGAHNINLVTPTHYLPHIVEAIVRARRQGLRVPIVYNSSGYESENTIKMLGDMIQIYLVDMRYSRTESALRLSQAPDYPTHNRRAVKQMLRQVGHLTCHGGVATRGLIVRHLLLPSLLHETKEILEFIAGDLSPDTAVSLMSQYFPANKASQHPEINRKITRQEYHQALAFLQTLGLDRGWIQDPEAPDRPVA